MIQERNQESKIMNHESRLEELPPLRLQRGDVGLDLIHVVQHGRGGCLLDACLRERGSETVAKRGDLPPAQLARAERGKQVARDLPGGVFAELRALERCCQPLCHFRAVTAAFIGRRKVRQVLAQILDRAGLPRPDGEEIARDVPNLVLFFGTRLRAASLASRPSLRPVTGSVLGVSLNGKALLIVG